MCDAAESADSLHGNGTVVDRNFLVKYIRYDAGLPFGRGGALRSAG